MWLMVAQEKQGTSSWLFMYVCVMSSKVYPAICFHITVQHAFTLKSGAVFCANTAQHKETKPMCKG